MKSLLFAVAIAGCGPNPTVTLPSDAHYRAAFDSSPTTLSLCKSGRAVYRANGAVEVGTYVMDDANQGADWLATIVTSRHLIHFDVGEQRIYGGVSDHWDVDDSLASECTEEAP